MLHEALFRSMPFCVVLLDADLAVRDASAACVDLIGVALDELIGQPLFDNLALPTAGPDPRERIRSAIAEGREMSCRATALGSDGAVRSVAVTVVPVANDGATYGLVRLSAEDEGGVAESAASAAGGGSGDRMRTIVDEIRSIKHEINNPLTGAIGNINMLLRRPDLDDRARKRLATAEGEMKKIGQLVERLSDLAAPEA